MYHRLVVSLVSVVLSLAQTGKPQDTSPLRLFPVATGLTQPVFATAPPADSSRLFILERAGVIRVVHNGVLLDRPFLDITEQVTHAGSEQGLLGLAFDPDYATTGSFYINYTRTGDGATVISHFLVSGDPDSADKTSEEIILSVSQPYANHNGGMLAFGPNDGYLYIGLGDGGSAGDPGNRAQDSTTLLGKILRLDINRSNGTLIPETNPYVDRPGWRGEIWALGLRNPWRFSFDRATGDLLIADVGQSSWEEVNHQPASSTGGENYGWRRKEGDHCFNPSSGCDSGFTLTDPIHEYSHGEGCSITGGYIYRGCTIPELSGAYIFGDFCSGEVWSLRYTDSVVDFRSLTSELGTDTLMITSFGEDAWGDLYIIAYHGVVYRIVPDYPASCGNVRCCAGTTGDINQDGVVTAQDLALLVASLLEPSRPPLACQNAANVSATGILDLTDVSLLVSYLTDSGIVLPVCP